jgi:hypothetical protein
MILLNSEKQCIEVGGRGGGGRGGGGGGWWEGREVVVANFCKKCNY